MSKYLNQLYKSKIMTNRTILLSSADTCCSGWSMQWSLEFRYSLNGRPINLIMLYCTYCTLNLTQVNVVASCGSCVLCAVAPLMSIVFDMANNKHLSVCWSPFIFTSKWSQLIADQLVNRCHIHVATIRFNLWIRLTL